MYAIASMIKYQDNSITRELWNRYSRFDVFKSIEETNHGRD